MRYIRQTRRPGFLGNFQLWNLGQTPAAPATSNPVSAGPVILGFQPGSANPGDTIIISGSGFTGASMVTFNGMVSTFQVVNDTQISALVPPNNQEGILMITTPAGTASSAASFSLLTPSPPSGGGQPGPNTQSSDPNAAPIPSDSNAPAPMPSDPSAAAPMPAPPLLPSPQDPTASAPLDSNAAPTPSTSDQTQNSGKGKRHKHHREHGDKSMILVGIIGLIIILLLLFKR